MYIQVFFWYAAVYFSDCLVSVLVAERHRLKVSERSEPVSAAQYKAAAL